MRTAHALDDLRAWRAAARETGPVAFVPTMGNLHDGHLALVRAARELADQVVVSIFVNPLQFGAGEDFDGYPRTLERDSALLADAGVDLLFSPTVAVMYPTPPERQTRVEVPGLSDILCGATRPGHFVGVATVVCKLFNMVQPDLAVFGRKDYQQLLVIRRMVTDLALPVRIVGIDTHRDDDGLAMSSRNGYLSAEERRIAPALHAALRDVADLLRRGAQDTIALELQAAQRIDAAGLRTDYVAVRRASDLLPPDPGDRDLVVLAAAYLGQARLIDNLEVVRGSPGLTADQ
jgi:pantoate--beta-alanine ligase